MRILPDSLRPQHIVNVVTQTALCGKQKKTPWPSVTPKTRPWSRACPQCLQKATEALNEPLLRAHVKHYSNTASDVEACGNRPIEVDKDDVPTFACPHCADMMLDSLRAAYDAVTGRRP